MCIVHLHASHKQTRTDYLSSSSRLKDVFPVIEMVVCSSIIDSCFITSQFPLSLKTILAVVVQQILFLWSLHPLMFSLGRLPTVHMRKVKQLCQEVTCPPAL